MPLCFVSVAIVATLQEFEKPGQFGWLELMDRTWRAHPDERWTMAQVCDYLDANQAFLEEVAVSITEVGRSDIAGA